MHLFSNVSWLHVNFLLNTLLLLTTSKESSLWGVGRDKVNSSANSIKETKNQAPHQRKLSSEVARL